ncbi:MAG: SdpI family protein [Acutalibacter sp.]
MKKRMAQNKGKLILSSLVILLPMAVFWFQAREMLFYPLLMLAGHWLCLVCVYRDKKNREQSKKALGMVVWLLPILSLFFGAVVLAVKQGAGAGLVMFLLDFPMGLLFFLLGNYLPKIRQNSTLGIRVRWTLQDEENWNASHRFGGKVWVACGLLCMAASLLGESMWSVLVVCLVVLVAAVIPCLYSYLYYRRQLREGRVEKLKPIRPWAIAVILVMVLAFGGFLGWTLLSGGVTMVYGDTSFTADASGWGDLTIPYEEITSIQYYSRDPSKDVAGIRTNGMGNLKMSLGSFQNELYGDYTRYTYGACDACVVLKADGRTVVLNGPDEASTQEIYQTLLEKTGLNAPDGSS